MTDIDAGLWNTAGIAGRNADPELRVQGFVVCSLQGWHRDNYFYSRRGNICPDTRIQVYYAGNHATKAFNVNGC